jgi:hypothetical protein
VPIAECFTFSELHKSHRSGAPCPPVSRTKVRYAENFQVFTHLSTDSCIAGSGKPPRYSAPRCLSLNVSLSRNFASPIGQVCQVCRYPALKCASLKSLTFHASLNRQPYRSRRLAPAILGTVVLIAECLTFSELHKSHRSGVPSPPVSRTKVRYAENY